MSKPISPSFASLVQEFFTDYMTRQRSLSPQTVASYRDSFLLLLRFAEQTLGKPATAFELSDLQPKFIASFLDHLERERGNSPRSRNIRLAALRSFLKFAARRDLASLSVIEQALAVPMKRFDRKMVGFLTREQMLAVIDVPTATWLGQRDHLLLMLMFNTGARAADADVQHRRKSVGDHRRAGGRRGPRHDLMRPPAGQGPQAALAAAVEGSRSGDT